MYLLECVIWLHVWHMLPRVQIQSYIKEVHHLLVHLNCNSQVIVVEDLANVLSHFFCFSWCSCIDSQAIISVEAYTVAIF